MNLREHTVYLRCSTRRDLLADGAVLGLVEGIAELTGEPFRSARDLGGHRQRPGAVQDGLKQLVDVSGLGVHVPCRMQLSARTASDDPERRVATQTLLLNIGEHPYTGNYHAAFDLRIPSARFEDPGFVEAFVDWVRTVVVPVTTPWMGHAHDSDDTSIQNTASRNLLRSGFGIELPDDAPWDKAENPGLEISRGDLRYMATWLTLVGPELRADLGAAAVDGLTVGEALAARETFTIEPPAGTEGEPRVDLLRLVDQPLPPDTALMRARQRAVRDALDFASRAAAKAYTMGYWDRGSR